MHYYHWILYRKIFSIPRSILPDFQQTRSYRKITMWFDCYKTLWYLVLVGCHTLGKTTLYIILYYPALIYRFDWCNTLWYLFRRSWMSYIGKTTLYIINYNPALIDCFDWCNTCWYLVLVGWPALGKTTLNIILYNPTFIRLL